MSRLTDERTRPVAHPIQTAKSSPALPVDAKRRRFADAITARIAATKRRLLAGGVLQEISWGVVVPVVLPDLPDPRGRKTYAYTTLHAFIEQRPALDRGRLDTDRADNTVLVIFDPVAILTEHQFRWGDPPHVYKIKAVEGLLKNAETGTRYASEVTVIR